MRDIFYLWTAALTPAQIAAITAAADACPVQDATIFASAVTVPDTRISAIRWLSDAWLRDLLWGYVQQANQAAFQVAVDPECEMQFTEYRAVDGGHYDWHHDVNWNSQAPQDRKLSVTVQLSDSGDYTGGDFEFDEVTTSADLRAAGTILVFPSYLRHRVAPVTSGVRESLVAWFSGPRWT